MSRSAQWYIGNYIIYGLNLEHYGIVYIVFTYEYLGLIVHLLSLL